MCKAATFGNFVEACMHEISCKLAGNQSTIERGAEDQVNEKASLKSPNTFLNKNESACCQKDKEKESLQTIERGAEEQVNERASLESPNSTLNTNNDEGTCCQKDKESLQSHKKENLTVPITKNKFAFDHIKSTGQHRTRPAQQGITLQIETNRSSRWRTKSSSRILARVFVFNGAFALNWIEDWYFG